MPFEVTKENAALFGQRVNAIVRGYIAAQNSIFKFSFTKALGLKKTAPATAAGRAEELRAQAASMLEEVRGLKLDADDPLGNFFMTMRPYLRGLDSAMEFFIAFCGRMEKAKREKDRAYWRGPYKEDLLKLQEKERAYLTIGFELNERWKKLSAQS